MWRAALALVVLLTACSESDKTKALEVLGHVEVAGGFAKVVARSDTLMVSDVLSVEGTERPSLTEYECITGTNTCTRTGVPLFEPVNVLGDLVGVTVNPDIERSDIRRYKGLGLAEYSATETRQGVQWTTSHYGAWLDYSAFETTIASGEKPGELNVLAAYNLSFGKRTGTAPQGNATWEGVMLGHTRGHGGVHPLQGDVILNFEFDAMTIDVFFTDIENLTTKDDYPNIQFDAVPVSNGAFTNRTATAHIAGRFYGPADDAHEEVGGVFTYPTALGAFGARKQ